MSDDANLFEILNNFERFSQKNDIYCRAFWDRSVRSPKTEMFFKTYREPLEHFRKVDGFQQRDYSIRNAAWHVPDIFAEFKADEDRREGFLDSLSVHREGPSERGEVDSPEVNSDLIKRVALAFGADLVGITRGRLEAGPGVEGA